MEQNALEAFDAIMYAMTATYHANNDLAPEYYLGDEIEQVRSALTKDLQTKLRRAILDKEWIIECARHETSKFGQWQSDWHSVMGEIDKEIDRILTED